jgi:hypothetical protein
MNPIEYVVHKREGSASKVFPEQMDKEFQEGTRPATSPGVVDEEERDICSPLPSEPMLYQPTKKRSNSSDNVGNTKSDSVDGSGSTLKKTGSTPSLGKMSHKSRSSFNLAERLSFSFMNDIIADGKRRDIMVGEYPPIEPIDDCQHLGKTILAMWDRDKQHGTPKLWNVLYRMFGVNFILAGIPYLVESALKLAQSYMLGLLLDWFELREDTTLWKGYLLASGLVAMVIGHSLLNQVKFFMVMMLNVDHADRNASSSFSCIRDIF